MMTLCHFSMFDESMTGQPSVCGYRRVVLPLARISEEADGFMGVVEFDTVALDGEILVELEGM